MTVVIFILILGLLVLAHEFGHFVTARKTGMRVLEFGFGFPPRAIGFYKDPETKKLVWLNHKNKKRTSEEEKESEQYPATVYSINWLPLGGFCQIKGENGDEVKEKDSFGFQKAWKRALVLSAGVIMNIILAGVLLTIGFTIGIPADLSGEIDSQAIIVEPAKVMVQNVEKKSPAEVAGLQFGDKVISIDGQKIVNSKQLIEYTFSHSDKEMLVVVERGVQELSFKMTPKVIKVGDTPRFGIMLADAGVIRYPWYIAIYKGFEAALFGLVNIFIALFYLLKNLIIGKGLLFDVSGPIGIAVLVGQSARMGFNYLLNVTAMISLSLAAMNILPIPALDGGRILFILIEKIIRRPIKQKYEQLAHSIGFFLLILLIVFITFRDVRGLF